MVPAFSYCLLIREFLAPAKACGIVLGKEALYRLKLEHCDVDLMLHSTNALYPHITDDRRFITVASNSVLQ